MKIPFRLAAFMLLFFSLCANADNNFSYRGISIGMTLKEAVASAEKSFKKVRTSDKYKKLGLHEIILSDSDQHCGMVERKDCYFASMSFTNPELGSRLKNISVKQSFAVPVERGVFFRKLEERYGKPKFTSKAWMVTAHLWGGKNPPPKDFANLPMPPFEEVGGMFVIVTITENDTEVFGYHLTLVDTELRKNDVDHIIRKIQKDSSKEQMDLDSSINF